MAALFETETCTRCGGSGSYSFNLVDGSRCFKCGGRKAQLTKRGAEAQRFYRESLKVAVGDLKAGDRVRLDVGIQAQKLKNGTVTDIAPDKYNAGRLSVGVRYDDGTEGGLCSPPEHRVLRCPTDADQERALAYQATLTKAGKPSKRSAGHV